jgi:hypothetical protein
MSHFYNSTTGARNTTSTKTGTKQSGMSSHTRGWNLGIEVIARYDEKTDTDRFYIYTTGGSNGSNQSQLIVEVFGTRDGKGTIINSLIPQATKTDLIHPAEPTIIEKAQAIRDVIDYAKDKASEADERPSCIKAAEQAIKPQQARWVYFVQETQRRDDGELIVCIATEGERGFNRTDWAWGKDMATAEAIADKKNEARGIDKREALKIICSTMR